MKTRVRRRRAVGSRTKAPQARRPGPARQDRQPGKDAPVLIGGAQDPAEKAADRAAGQALAGGPVTTTATAGGGVSVQRACASCEAEKDQKEGTAHRAPSATSTVAGGASAGPAGPSASASIRSLDAGKPLAPADRAYFEPRFGRDFSGVRVHEGAEADRAARAIDARAFAWGGDIAFARGEREKGGAHLMAHELAHVAADGGTDPARRTVRRATIAATDGPKAYKAVPDDHKVNVQRALDLVDNALKAQRCQDFFKDKCSVSAVENARKTFDAATVYYLSDKSNRFGLSDVRASDADPSRVAYNQRAYDIGRWEVAATLLHEMFHTCDFTQDDMDEILAEQAAEACGFYAPWILSATPASLDVGDTVTLKGYQFGQAQDADHYIEMGGSRITSYDSWEQAKGASSVKVEFKVPATINDNWFFSKDVDLVAVNHGHKSNAKSINVDP